MTTVEFLRTFNLWRRGQQAWPDSSGPNQELVGKMIDKACDDLEMLERRLRLMAGSNADDWRWYQNAARQAIRSLEDRQPGQHGAEKP